MPELSELMPHIKRAATANALLFIYYISPSFLAFLAIVVALFVIIFDNPYETFTSLMNHSKDTSFTDLINHGFNQYTALSIVQQIIVVVILKVMVDFTWLFPTWLIVFLVVQVYGAWGFLRELGVVERVGGFVEQGQLGLEKVVAMIPKHQRK